MKPERFLDLITAMKCICSLMCFGITSLLQDLQHDNTLRSELITTYVDVFVCTHEMQPHNLLFSALMQVQRGLS